MLTLDLLVGQPRAVDLLRHALTAHGRLHHAYLFAGPPGVGKRTAALALAAAIACPEAPGSGCGRCNACRHVATGTHPDVLHIVPDRSKARPEIKIEQVREELLPRLAFLPNESPSRIVLLEDADLMNPIAANALLKTLEEPPNGTRFVLTCDAPSRLPATIPSRCQVVRFVPLGEEPLVKLLVERHGFADADARAAARLAEGSPGNALAVAASGEAASQADLARRVLTNALERQGTSSVASDAWAQRTLLPGALILARQLIRDALVETSAAHAADDLVRSLARRPPADLFAAAQTLEDTRVALEGNANPQVWLEALSVRLGRVLMAVTQ